MRINNELKKYWLATKMVENGVGAIGLRKSSREFDRLSTEQVKSVISEDFIGTLEQSKVKIVAEWEEEYPKLLRQVASRPLLLFCIGDISLLRMPSITIVGSRQVTSYGRNVVKEFFNNRVNLSGYVTVSGLAFGIDSEVHKSSIKAGIPTIAVIPAGITDVVPRSHSQLYKEICAKGLVISEFPPGREPFIGMFPMRNRILAALSMQTFVVEAGENSGALITAKYALDYSRDVLAVPGSIFSPSSIGTNKLIAEGARPIYCKEEFHASIKGIDLTNMEMEGILSRSQGDI